LVTHPHVIHIDIPVTPWNLYVWNSVNRILLAAITPTMQSCRIRQAAITAEVTHTTIHLHLGHHLGSKQRSLLLCVNVRVSVCYCCAANACYSQF